MSTSNHTELYQQIETWVAPIHLGYTHKMRFLKIEAYWQIGQLLTLATHQMDKLDCKDLLETIAQRLLHNYGKQYSYTALQTWCRLYTAYPDHALLATNLSWSHYRILLRVEDDAERYFYTKEAANYQWSTTHLRRQIKAKHYERLINTPQPFDQEGKPNVKYLLKDLYLFEFLDFAQKNHLLEKDLEDALVNKLQTFLMELGNGFAFVARQKQIATASGKRFFIDLVCYHFVLKCFVVLELKVGALSHRDIGQLDMYVRMFDDRWKAPEDNPTIGIVFCASIDPTIKRYSALHNNPQLHAAYYQFEEDTKPSLEPHVLAALERLKN